MPRKKKESLAAAGRRGSMVIEENSERGLAMRLLLYSPRDLLAAMFASAAVVAIISNAIFMQAGRHPSPMFGAGVLSSAEPAMINPLPRPRPVEAQAKSEPRMESQLLEPKAAEVRPAEMRQAESRSADPLANLARTANSPATPATGALRPPASIPKPSRDPLGELIVSSRRVASVQRALTEYGYGQLKPTGTVGSDTQAAIQRFERARKIPVTGQMSDRLVRELNAVTGRPID